MRCLGRVALGMFLVTAAVIALMIYGCR